MPSPWHSHCHQGSFHGEIGDQGAGALRPVSTSLGPGMVCSQIAPPGDIEKKGRERSGSKAGGPGHSAYSAVRLFPFELGIGLRSLVSFKTTLSLGSLPRSLLYLPRRKQVHGPCSGLGCWEAGTGWLERGQSRLEGGGPSLRRPLRASRWRRGGAVTELPGLSYVSRSVQASDHSAFLNQP